MQGDTESAEYGGRGMCDVEFGHNQVAGVNVTFLSGLKPFGDRDGASSEIADDKIEFGRSRIQRWFGRAWVDSG